MPNYCNWLAPKAGTIVNRAVSAMAQLAVALRRPVDPKCSRLPARTLRSIQAATFRYNYAGRRCIKNPFDLALYSMLISRERPGTIIEIGSAAGGSALWFACQCRGLGLDTQVLSVDINPVVDLEYPGVSFLAGDIHDLQATRLPELLVSAKRPFLVIEDGPHTREACLAALNFFDQFLQRGEYIVIEDGILYDLGYWQLQNGPNRAVAEFLATHGTRYTCDREMCDFFGRNFTWNTNGYLRRI
jgi:cephalosporin hydroxylase